MITITAATGRYGRLVVDELLARGLTASELTVTVRNPELAADLTARGVSVRHADYDRPETLTPAFEGTDRLLLIPSADYGKRAPQARAAVDAAVAAGVSLIAYASFVNAETSTLRLAEEHKETEAHIRKSGLRHVFLRNGAYTELYCGELGDLGPALDAGVLVGSGGDGKVSGSTRPDLAAAAATVLLTEHPKDAYELGGTPFTLSGLASEIARQSGRPLAYHDLPVEAYAAGLAEHGVPQAFAELLADTSFAIRRGDWYTDSTDLAELIGRAPAPLADSVRAGLANM